MEEEACGKKEKEERQGSRTKIVEDEIRFDTTQIRVEEVRAYIRRTKRRKAAGPDEVQIEFFKELLDEDEAMEALTKQLKGKEGTHTRRTKGQSGTSIQG